jgi:hypothetical protein
MLHLNLENRYIWFLFLAGEGIECWLEDDGLVSFKILSLKNPFYFAERIFIYSEGYIRRDQFHGTVWLREFRAGLAVVQACKRVVLVLDIR